MKKIIFAFACFGIIGSVSAQQGKLVSTWNALESYKKGDGVSNLESALPYINEGRVSFCFTVFNAGGLLWAAYLCVKVSAGR